MLFQNLIESYPNSNCQYPNKAIKLTKVLPCMNKEISCNCHEEVLVFMLRLSTLREEQIRFSIRLHNIILLSHKLRSQLTPKACGILSVLLFTCTI